MGSRGAPDIWAKRNQVLGPNLLHLTSTERLVMEAFARGRTRAQVAASLHLSVHTVGHLLTTSKEKLYAHTLAEAAATFCQLALFDAMTTGSLTGAVDPQRRYHES